MGSLILDAVVAIVARLATMLILMLLLTLASLIAMAVGVVFVVVGQVWPPLDPPYVVLSQRPELLRIETGVVSLGRLIGVSVLLVHGFLVSLVHARAPILGVGERLRRVGVAVLLAPVGLALSVAMANIIVAVLAGISAPARRFVEDAQLLLGVVGTTLFAMLELTAVLLVANVVSYLDAFVAGLATFLYCIQFVFIAVLTILHRVTQAFFSLTLHAAVLVGFASAPAGETDDEEIRRFADIADRVISRSPIGFVLRWTLTISAVLALAGGLLEGSQRMMMDAFYVAARAAASTNYGLLRASGQRTEAALRGVYQQLQREPPQDSCSFSGGESPCAARLARVALSALITLLISVIFLGVIYQAAERAAPEVSGMAQRTYQAARGRAREIWGRAPGWLQAGGERLSSSVLGAWRWISRGREVAS